MTDFDRLHTAGDIHAVFAARTVAHGTAVALHARRRSDDGPPRAAVIVGRKIGNAVHRNRAKRRLRAVLRETAAPRGLDLVVVARSPALTTDFPELTQQVARLLERVTDAACQRAISRDAISRDAISRDAISRDAISREPVGGGTRS